MDRRRFVGLASLAAASGALAPLADGVSGRGRIQAVAFDAIAIFDPRPVFLLAEELLPGNGAKLSEAWRLRQFEYTWLRVASRQYRDFWLVTEDALIFAARQVGVALSSSVRDALMQQYRRLKPWPDASPALKTLKRSGIRLGLLSNFTPQMLRENVSSAGLQDDFDHLFSTDAARTYKPDPRAYALARDAWRLKREEIGFVAFGGWDAAGAKLFGYPTFWANRMRQPEEELGAPPDAIAADLAGLAGFVQQHNAS